MDTVMTDIPMVSIVICTYNRAHYIRETIQSIITQTYKNWELLIMDNGSDDTTKQVVESIADSRISYYKYEPTTTGRLRNIAFDKAKGNYIALMDSDDLWLPDKLEKQISLLLANPYVHFSFTNSIDFRGEKEIVAVLNPETEGISIANVFNDFIEHRIKPPIQTFLFHKKCLDVSGRFYEDRIFNDYRFIGSLIYHFEAAIINEPLLLRRLHQNNSVDVYSEELADEYVEAVNAFKKAKMVSVSLGNKLAFITRINSGNIYLECKQWQKSLKNYWAAWLINPASIIPVKKIAKTILMYLKNIPSH